MNLKSKNIYKTPSGSIILEAVLAVALLATAGVALAKLSRGAATLSQQSDHAFAASLAAENAMHRIIALTSDEIIEQAGAIEDSVAEGSGCDVNIIVERFTSGDYVGVHTTIEVTTSPSARVVRHQWQLDTPKDPA